MISFMLNEVIPDEVKKGDYYQYMGSLTVPPCREGIYWTVFEKTIKISASQVYNRIFEKDVIKIYIF
jgi:carbonic anhydrase